jgi:hypothetical protein
MGKLHAHQCFARRGPQCRPSALRCAPMTGGEYVVILNRGSALSQQCRDPPHAGRSVRQRRSGSVAAITRLARHFYQRCLCPRRAAIAELFVMSLQLGTGWHESTGRPVAAMHRV